MAVATVAAVREAVVPDVDLLIELHRRLAPAWGARLTRKLEPYDPFWIEEPVSSTHLSGLRQVREASGTPVVTGEALYGHAAFREVFAQEAADIINPDVAACGGILELTQIAATADTFHVAVAPHNYNSPTIAFAATLQASAVMPNFLITEYFVNFEDSAFDLVESRFEVKDGYVSLPVAPGMGIAVDEDAVARRLGSARAGRQVLTQSGEER